MIAYHPIDWERPATLKDLHDLQADLDARISALEDWLDQLADVLASRNATVGDQVQEATEPCGAVVTWIGDADTDDHEIVDFQPCADCAQIEDGICKLYMPNAS